MKIRFFFLLLAFIGSAALHAETTFTYQGRLGNAGAPAEGPHDFVFRLFNAEAGGSQIGGDLARDAVDVTDGVFTVQLDFGDVPFSGSPRWLEIDVRESGTGAYSTLAPRNRLGASPFAVQTLMVAPGAVDTEALQDGAVTTAKIADGAVTTAKIADGAVTRQRMANNAVDTAVIADGTVTTNDIRDSNITSPKFAVGAVDSRAIADGAVASAELGTAAVTSDKIANGAVDSAQVANQSIAAIDLASGSVGTDEIIDGTITPDDIDGGLYSRKGQVQYYTATVNVGFGIQRVTVSCAGAREIPVVQVCNVPTDNSDLTILSERLTSLDNDVTPARLRCTAENRAPANSEVLTATIGCIPVP